MIAADAVGRDRGRPRPTTIPTRNVGSCYLANDTPSSEVKHCAFEKEVSAATLTLPVVEEIVR
jgi:hypothetical protein